MTALTFCVGPSYLEVVCDAYFRSLLIEAGVPYSHSLWGQKYIRRWFPVINVEVVGDYDEFSYTTCVRGDFLHRGEVHHIPDPFVVRHFYKIREEDTYRTIYPFKNSLAGQLCDGKLVSDRLIVNNAISGGSAICFSHVVPNCLWPEELKRQYLPLLSQFLSLFRRGH